MKPTPTKKFSGPRRGGFGQARPCFKSGITNRARFTAEGKPRINHTIHTRQLLAEIDRGCDYFWKKCGQTQPRVQCC